MLSIHTHINFGDSLYSLQRKVSSSYYQWPRSRVSQLAFEF